MEIIHEDVNFKSQLRNGKTSLIALIRLLDTRIDLSSWLSSMESYSSSNIPLLDFFFQNPRLARFTIIYTL